GPHRCAYFPSRPTGTLIRIGSGSAVRTLELAPQFRPTLPVIIDRFGTAHGWRVHPPFTDSTNISVVMAGHSASEDARARAYAPAIHDLLCESKDVDARDTSAFTRVFRRAMRGHDVGEAASTTAARSRGRLPPRVRAWRADRPRSADYRRRCWQSRTA